MHGAAELLSELGSEDRLKILSAIRKEPMKLGRLAENLSTTIQEVSRQCGRLERKGLIERHPDASYGLTSIGYVALSLIPSFELLDKEREYLRSHDVSSLPSKFLERLGDLLEHKRLEHIDDALKFQERVVKESRRFVWFMSDQPVGHSFRESHAHFSPETTLRVILPKNTDLEMFRSARAAMGSRFEIGLVDEVKIVIAMNEKIAGFGLPSNDGRSDYTRGILSESASFNEWCRDLFSYYWEKAEETYRWE